jgi:hypothetical protein
MRAADYQHPSGEWRAWKCEPTPDAPACLALYLLFCPGAHAAWSWWQLSLCHLRDLAGLPPASKQFPEATHEILILSINPEACPLPDPDSPPWPYLTPFDLVEQVMTNDENGKQILARMVETIMTGRVSPDVDFRRYWQQFIQAAAQVLEQETQ